MKRAGGSNDTYAVEMIDIYNVNNVFAFVKLLTSYITQRNVVLLFW